MAFGLEDSCLKDVPFRLELLPLCGDAMVSCHQMLFRKDHLSADLE